MIKQTIFLLFFLQSYSLLAIQKKPDYGKLLESHLEEESSNSLTELEKTASQTTNQNNFTPNPQPKKAQSLQAQKLKPASLPKSAIKPKLTN